MLTLCAAVFVISMVGVGRTLWISKRENDSFSQLAKIAGGDAAPSSETEAASETKAEAASGDAQEPRRNYEELYNMNHDFAGWLRIKGTKLDYPVMHTPEDMQYYIRRDFYGKSSVSGTPFIGDDCDENSQSVIIYGHNMKNGTMFGELDEYQKQSWWRDHPIIEFDTRQENREYQVFAAFRTELSAVPDAGFPYYSYVGELTEEKFQEFIERAKAASYYDTGIVPQYGDQLLILSTCSYHTDNGRFVVVARRPANSSDTVDGTDGSESKGGAPAASR